MKDPRAEALVSALAPDVGVIRSKILPKRLPSGAISRPRLVERLRAGKGRSLTLVSAPAGYGKTTLLSAWLSSSSRLSAHGCRWTDATPTRFGSGLT